MARAKPTKKPKFLTAKMAALITKHAKLHIMDSPEVTKCVTAICLAVSSAAADRKWSLDVATLKLKVDQEYRSHVQNKLEALGYEVSGHSRLSGFLECQISWNGK